MQSGEQKTKIIDKLWTSSVVKKEQNYTLAIMKVLFFQISNEL